MPPALWGTAGGGLVGGLPMVPPELSIPTGGGLAGGPTELLSIF